MKTESFVSSGYYENENHSSVEVICCNVCERSESEMYDGNYINEIESNYHICKHCEMNDKSLIFMPKSKTVMSVIVPKLSLKQQVFNIANPNF